MVLSAWLASRYDDDQLARLYGDAAWFGRGAFGLEAGALAWFGRPLDQLSTTQAAMLVGSGYRYHDPTVHPDRALLRRQHVLRAWQVCGLIPPGSAITLERTPVLDGVVLRPGMTPITEDEDE